MLYNVLGGRDEWSCSSDREIREGGGRKTVKILRYRSVKKIVAAGVMLFMWIGSTMAVPVYAGTPECGDPDSGKCTRCGRNNRAGAGESWHTSAGPDRASDRKKREAKLRTDTL